MTKPTATGGNEPKFKTVKEYFDAYKKAITARPRPKKRVFKYTYDPATGLVTVDVANLAAMIQAREEASLYEEDLKMWYEQQGVSQEPWLKGETWEQYKERTRG